VKYLNLGCGYRYHPDWTNINFISTGEGVIAHNLKQGIPFPDASFDVVYHSHVLEHFPKSEAESFIKECYRVLRPQGILRVVVPDLEEIARMYLHSLEKASHGFEEWEQNYHWMLLEMYDQTVRNDPGGEMKSFLSQKELSNQEFVVKRCGVEIKNIILSAQNQISSPKPVPENLISKLIKHIYRLLRYSDYRHQAILQIILSPTELESLKIGQFRQSGEIHQWMYDHYSLSVLLKNCGLEKITKRTADESYINGWTSFNLDTEPDGSIYKPDSLYMEAVKSVL
jgi:predicted SAM-dependent methyltransferase